MAEAHSHGLCQLVLSRCARGNFSSLCVQMKGMGPSTKHLLLLSAIPVIYPMLGALETLLKTFDEASQTTEAVLFKTGAPLLAMSSI
jgi:hypothetical protein